MLGGDCLKRAEIGAIVSITAYVILATAKILFGILGSSDSLFADGLNSFSDILVSIVILVGIILAKKPRDEEHPYGHGRIEYITTIVASFLMMFVAFQVISSGVIKVFDDSNEKPALFTAWIAFASSFIILSVGIFNYRLGKKLNSGTLDAVAKDNFSDALVSFGAGVAIITAFYKIAWVDPLMSIIIGLAIAWTALKIFLEASNHLIDGFDSKKTNIYRDSIFEIEGVKEILSLRGRTYGHEQHLDIIISVEKHLTVLESHKICDDVEKKLIADFGIHCAIVHVEPFEAKNKI